MIESMEYLNDGIVRRLHELHYAAEQIAKIAHRITITANILKLTSIILGAVTATKSTFDIIVGAHSQTSLLLFAILGLTITIVAGVEATFKLEKRGAELILLASAYQSSARSVDSEWRKYIGSNPDTDQRDAAREIISTVDKKLNEMQAEAAKLGVNLALDRYLRFGEEEHSSVALHAPRR